MPTTPEQFDEMRQRTEAAIARGKQSGAAGPGVALVHAVTLLEGVSQERKLHDQIMWHCDNQWPRWKYIHARMDKRSTIAVGAPDFVIFLPVSRTLCVECKKKGAKPTTEQLGWHKEMQMLGHKVHVISSIESFLGIVINLPVHYE